MAQDYGRLSRAGIAVVCILFAGCRVPEPVVVKPRQSYTHYDTDYEAILARNDSPLLSESWGRYVETLDEPVAIEKWNDGISTWKIHYATNRAVDESLSDPDIQRYGNQVLTRPTYGVAQITLPHRRRGKAVEQSPSAPRKSILPVFWKKEKAPEEFAHLEQVQSVDVDSFLAGVTEQVERSRQRDVLLFVHGFNVDFESSLVRTTQLALDMPFNGAVIAYSWPTQGGVKNYSADEPINAASVQPFADFLWRLRNGLPADTRVHILVHSMGNRIVLQALNRLPQAPPGRKPFANICLCAPDVGIDDYRVWVPGVVARSERVTLYASTNDTALVASKATHAGQQRAGDAVDPLVMPGVETIDCSTIDFSFMGHSYYGDNLDVLTDLFNVIKEDQPAASRSHLSERSTDGQTHWVFTQHPVHVLWTWHFEPSND